MPAPLIDLARLKIRSDVPPHRQVAAYLKAVIALGQLSPGDGLPSVSALAGQVGAPTSEVKRAYEELEQRGFLVSEAGKWRVSDEHAAIANAADADDICERMWDLIAEARRAGMTRSELQRMFGQLLSRP
ncbi:MAG TPA: GntR family transcriptional regulator [Planctomycetota bacterium]|jgi:GntR family transcriptional regulator|nr:GntR family transcriptional regulator [Planctomycetota bacterium]